MAAAGLIAGFAVALATGSRPLGGVVLAAFGLLLHRRLAAPRRPADSRAA